MVMNAIETINLTRRFGERTAVDQLTLTVPCGCVLGFLGPNGAGKTTTVRMLAALVAPTAGEAFVAGHRLGQANDEIRAAVGVLTESPGLYGALTARQNLRFFAQINGIDRREADRRIDRYLELLGLVGRDRDRAGEFSKGMRQKLAIARALLHEPQLIFLDEPTSALDPESARTVRDSIRMLRGEGRTVVLATHNLAEAEELCDMIALFRTRLIRVDTAHALRSSVSVPVISVRLAAAATEFSGAIAHLDVVRSVELDADRMRIELRDAAHDTPEVVRALVAAGAPIIEVTPMAPSLEEIYLQLMSAPAGGAGV
jgi:ABC-2 type transport system ATP-binding protein